MKWTIGSSLVVCLFFSKAMDSLGSPFSPYEMDYVFHKNVFKRNERKPFYFNAHPIRCHHHQAPVYTIFPFTFCPCDVASLYVANNRNILSIAFCFVSFCYCCCFVSFLEHYSLHILFVPLLFSYLYASDFFFLILFWPIKSITFEVFTTLFEEERKKNY